MISKAENPGIKLVVKNLFVFYYLDLLCFRFVIGFVMFGF